MMGYAHVRVPDSEMTMINLVFFFFTLALYALHIH